MRKRNLTLAVLAVCMVLGLSVKSAMAYFSVSVRAEGHTQVSFSEETTVIEEFDNWTKHLTVTNEGDDNGQVYVRAKAYAPEGMTLTYSGENWTEGSDGYWYYGSYIGNGQSTTVLDVKIENAPKAAEGDSFNVVVVYETLPVQYNSDGTVIAAADADWDMEVKNND